MMHQRCAECDCGDDGPCNRVRGPHRFDAIMDAIEAQRALNNKHFMRMWRLAFKHAPEEAREIQQEIRRGDLIISELNKQLCE